jgi:hypothetical protein
VDAYTGIQLRERFYESSHLAVSPLGGSSGHTALS